MNEADLLLKSLGLLVIGMGIVYGFLLLLVGAVRLMSRFALRLTPVEPVRSSPAGPAPPPTSDAASDELIAVLAAAVTRYRGGR